MKSLFERIRKIVLLPLVIIGWYLFLLVAKCRWLIRGRAVLAVCPPEMTCTPDATWLARAEPSDTDEFIARRMNNRLRKILGANWHILYEDDRFVYYGRPHSNFGAGGMTKLQEFGVVEWYRVERQALAREFAGYATVDGRCVREALSGVFETHPEHADLCNQWVAERTTEDLRVRASPDADTDHSAVLRFSLTDGRWIDE